MPKDYAKRARRPARKFQGVGRRIKFIILALLLIIAIMLSYWVYFRHASVNNHIVFWDRFKIGTQTTETPPKVAKPKIQKPADPQVRFDFYNDLPKMQVTIPEDANDSASNTATKVYNPGNEKNPPEKNTGYILEFGVFNDSTSASRLRISLLLAGFEAELTTIRLGEQLMYRVQRGPFISQNEAKKLQKRLQKKGIESALKKV